MPNKTDHPNDTEKPAPKSFTFWLAKLSSGEAESHLSYELQKLLERMDEEAHTRNKEVKGSLSLKLNFAVDETGAVGVVFDIATKEPPRKTTPSIYWLNNKSQLVDNNPRQQEIPGLRDVGGGKREFRAVDAPDVVAPREV